MKKNGPWRRMNESFARKNRPWRRKNGPLSERMDPGSERMSLCQKEWTLAIAGFFYLNLSTVLLNSFLSSLLPIQLPIELRATVLLLMRSAVPFTSSATTAKPLILRGKLVRILSEINLLKANRIGRMCFDVNLLA